MRRWLFNLAAAVSLMICLACALLWARSYWVGEAINYLSIQLHEDENAPHYSILRGSECTGYWVASARGGAGIGRLRNDGAALIVGKQGWQYQRWPESSSSLVVAGTSNDRVNLHLAGFQLLYRLEGTPTEWSSQSRLIIPYWFAFLAACVMCSISFARRNRPSPWACRVCGYDLRATPDRCPECGAEATQAKPQPAEAAARYLGHRAH